MCYLRDGNVIKITTEDQVEEKMCDAQAGFTPEKSHNNNIDKIHKFIRKENVQKWIRTSQI